MVVCTLRADHLTPYGAPAPSSTFLGRLAARGATFEQVVSASSWTAPATASILTSLHPHQHGVVAGLRESIKESSRRRRPVSDVNRIPEVVETLAESLRAAGYATFGVVDNPNVCEALGFAAGFDRFRTFNYRGAEHLAHELLEHRAEIAAAERRFLFLGFIDPHQPYHRWPGWDGAPGPPVLPGRKTIFSTSRYPGVATADPASASLDQVVAAYDSEIARVDLVLARLHAALSWEDALVIVVGDHGEELLERGALGHGTTLHREVTHVPLLIAGPGIRPRLVRDVVGAVDIAPTVRELAGLAPMAAAQGRSLVPLLEGRALAPRAAMAQLERRGRSVRALVTERHELIVPHREGRAGAPALYDLERDPGERRDVAREEAATLRRLSRELRRLEALPAVAAAPAEVTLDDEQRGTLESLGYVD